MPAIARVARRAGDYVAAYWREDRNADRRRNILSSMEAPTAIPQRFKRVPQMRTDPREVEWKTLHYMRR